MSCPRRYFWCDEPSPLHDALRSAEASRRKGIDAANEIARSVGAKSAVILVDGQVCGFEFEEPPACEPPYFWRKGERGDLPNYYYAQKRTVAGRALRKKIDQRFFDRLEDAVLKAATGMWIMQLFSCYMVRSTCGWSDGRIFISVPNAANPCGDAFPETIPNYLTECREWEMQRWFDLGRAGTVEVTA